MACCLMAPSHYLNQCWLIISKVLWLSCEGNFPRDTSIINNWNLFENYKSKISFKFPRGQWVNMGPHWNISMGCGLGSGAWFNINMLSYQYRKSHCGDKTVVRSSYLHNGISYTGKITSLYGIRAQVWTFLSDPRASWLKLLSGVPDYFDRNKISSGGDLSHYSSASLY